MFESFHGKNKAEVPVNPEVAEGALNELNKPAEFKVDADQGGWEMNLIPSTEVKTEGLSKTPEQMLEYQKEKGETGVVDFGEKQ
ncbi:MAG: hypothetical protein ACI9BF_000779 [Candidatus Paceibacteria bacterium]|jgi:hypothetical protein